MCPSILLVTSKRRLAGLLTDCVCDTAAGRHRWASPGVLCVPVCPHLRAARAGRVVTPHSPKPVAVVFSGAFGARGQVARSVQQNLPLAPGLSRLSLRHSLPPRLRELLHFLRDRLLGDVLERRERKAGVTEARNCGREQDFPKHVGLC